MTRGLAYSKGLVILCSAAIAALGAMFGACERLKSTVREHQRRASDNQSNLLVQITAGAEYENDRLEALRNNVHRIRLQVGANNTWDRIVKRFGGRWTVEAGPKKVRYGCSVQDGVFELKSPALADWFEIIDTLGDSEALPGVGVSEFTMKASGDLERRSLDLVRVVVTVQTRQRGFNVAESR